MDIQIRISGVNILIFVNLIWFFDLIIMVYMIRKKIHFILLFYFAWISIQITCIGILTHINGNFNYENPILGKLNIQPAITWFYLVAVIVKLVTLTFYPKSARPYSNQVEDYLISLRKFPVLRLIIVSVWPLYILDIFLGHSILTLPISLLMTNFGFLVIIIPFLTKFYRKLFWLLLVLVLPFALASGSRGPLMFPIAMFLLGSFLKNDFNLRYMIRMVLLSFPILIGSSLLGVARYAARYGADQSFSGQITNLFTATYNIINESNDIILKTVMTLADRLVQWPIFVAAQRQLDNPISVPFSWFDELAFSFSVSGLSNSPHEIQTQILNSGMLYGLLNHLGYQPSVGWTVPANIFVEATIRMGLPGLIFTLILPILIFTLLTCLRKNVISNILILSLPGLLIFRIPETHSVYLVKQLAYFLVLVIILYVTDRLLPKKNYRNAA